ncbi:MAG: hypothetical protein ACRYFS_05185 [Janthinobacterium lividum]
MPRYSSLLTCFALTTSALFSAFPAFAQQPTPPSTVVPAPVSDTTPLVIPPPPGGKLRVEMDARSEDLLGMAKSFLKGIGETGTPILGLTPGQTATSPAQAQNPVAQAIASGDLAAMLKDVNHVHIAVYEVAAPTTRAVAVILANPAVPKSPLAAPVFAAPLPVVPTFDSNSFYETAFAAEGAHRILYTDADAYKLVMVGFPDRHGFAFAASGGGYVIVERSDGYPNLEVLSAFISHVTTAVMNSQTGKKMMNSALNTGKDADPEIKTLLKK